jgi:hypothetical protein
MALAPYTPTSIVLPVADRVLGTTVLKQLATFVSLHHDYDAHDQPQARIVVSVQMFGIGPDGSLGPALVGDGFSKREIVLMAANDTLVDAATGEILAIRTFAAGENWQAVLDRYEQPTMLQGNFFEYLRDNAAINIGGLIRQHIQNADALGRFA